MKKNMRKLFLLMAVVMTAMVCLAFSAGAAKEGYYTYSVSDGKATITEVDKSISGAVTIPSRFGRYKVTEIGGFAFSHCTKIKSIVIPNGVTKIGPAAFDVCSSLADVKIPDSVTNVQYGTFNDCTNLKNVTLSKNISAISEGMFENCKKLTNITLSDNIKFISHSAFKNCISLSKISIPDGVTSIEPQAFENTKYYNTASNWKNNTLYIGKHLIKVKENVSGSYKIANGTKTIAGGAFKNCKKITAINIPESVVDIGSSAFANCARIKSITIPDGVTSINNWLFENCKSLESVIIPDSVTLIGPSAFANCKSLMNITIPDSVTSIDSSILYNSGYYNNAANWKNNVLYVGKYLIEAKDDISGSYKINKGTKVIASWAFNFCENLTGITVPSSVAVISDYAFYGCTALKNIKLPDSVKDIGHEVFAETEYYNTASNWEGNVLYIDNHLIKADAKLSGSYKIKAGTKSIAGHAFTSCSGLTNVIIPDGLKRIGKAAFCFCSRITSITIPESVVFIDLSAFQDCSNIKDVYYAGSADKWKKIRIEKHNNYLTDATIHYNAAVPGVTSKVSAVQNVNTIKLTWSKVMNADGYRVYMYNTSTKKWVNQKTLTATSLTINKLKAGTAYRFKIVAYNKVDNTAIWGDYTPTITVATKPTAPKITKLTAAKAKATLTWSDVNGENGYEIYASTKKDSGFKKVAATKADITKATVSKLTSGKTWYFKVRAYKTAGETKVYSAWSAATALKVK